MLRFEALVFVFVPLALSLRVTGLLYDIGATCCYVNIQELQESFRNETCVFERQSCNTICGGLDFIAQNGNDCNRDTFEYSCQCTDGFKPNMSEYVGSVPGQVCFTWKSMCVDNYPDDPVAQSRCNEAECPTKVAARRNPNSMTSLTSQITSISTDASTRSSLTEHITSESSSTTISVSPTIATSPVSQKLSPGAKAGIGVGTSIVGAIVLGLGFAFFRRRISPKRANLPGPAAEESKMSASPGTYQPPAELPDNNSYSTSLRGGAPSELFSCGYPHSDETSLNPTISRYSQQPGAMPPILEAVATPPTTEAAEAPSPPPSETLSLSPPAGTGRRSSAQDVERLEEEERWIDSEIEQIERVRGLREQKFEIQKRLLEARGR